MSFRKIVSAIAAATILTASLALGSGESLAAAKPPAHKEIACKPGLVAHPVKVGDKVVWKCGKPHATATHVKAKSHPKTAKKLVCKKGSVARKVKKHGKWAWECFKLKPAAPARK
jgi:hypothetical protein